MIERRVIELFRMPKIRYAREITDHLGNLRVLVSEDGVDDETEPDILSHKDYYPNGMRMPCRCYVSSDRYRFGYQWSERDEASGMDRFRLRSYDSRLGRWFAPDPMGQFHSPYLAMGNNPVTNIDPTGGYTYEVDGRPTSSNYADLSDEQRFEYLWNKNSDYFYNDMGMPDFGRSYHGTSAANTDINWGKMNADAQKRYDANHPITANLPEVTITPGEYEEGGQAIHDAITDYWDALKDYYDFPRIQLGDPLGVGKGMMAGLKYIAFHKAEHEFASNYFHGKIKIPKEFKPAYNWDTDGQGTSDIRHNYLYPSNKSHNIFDYVSDKDASYGGFTIEGVSVYVYFNSHKGSIDRYVPWSESNSGGNSAIPDGAPALAFMQNDTYIAYMFFHTIADRNKIINIYKQVQDDRYSYLIKIHHGQIK